MSDISTQKFTNISGDNLIILPDTTGASNGDVLTYNTTNGIIWNAPERVTELTAGTDLTINEGIISVNTTSTAAGNYSFAVGEDCYASDYGDTLLVDLKLQLWDMLHILKGKIQLHKIYVTMLREWVE